VLIEGVKIIDLLVNEDDRGSLTVVARAAQDSRPNGVIETFGEVVCGLRPGSTYHPSIP
jgi:dTDP-4-dehydrorhamnose 3,5-epimerase-like enzyme